MLFKHLNTNNNRPNIYPHVGIASFQEAMASKRETIEIVQRTYSEGSLFPFSLTELSGNNMPADFIPDLVTASILTASLLNLISSCYYHSLMIATSLFCCPQCALKPAVFGAVKVSPVNF